MNTRWVTCSASLLFAAACGDDVMLNGGSDDSDVVIRAHLAPDESCNLDTKSRVLSRGSFDIGGGDVESCARAYDLNLLVDNRSAYDIVFDEAEVTLTTSMDQPLVFHDDPEEALPNPFTTRFVAPVAGKALDVVTVQVISSAYAPFLGVFDGGEVVAVVELRGKSDTGTNVTSRKLTFPIDICDGCLTVCNGDVPEGMSLDDIYGTECRDHAAADDRVCVDPDC